MRTRSKYFTNAEKDKAVMETEIPAIVSAEVSKNFIEGYKVLNPNWTKQLILSFFKNPGLYDSNYSLTENGKLALGTLYNSISPLGVTYKNYSGSYPLIYPIWPFKSSSSTSLDEFFTEGNSYTWILYFSEPSVSEGKLTNGGLYLAKFSRGSNADNEKVYDVQEDYLVGNYQKANPSEFVLDFSEQSEEIWNKLIENFNLYPKEVFCYYNNYVSVDRVDDSLSETSDNPVKNRAITNKLNSIEGKIPTKTSQLVNDSGYITADDVPISVPTKLSELENDQNFVTETELEKIKETQRIDVTALMADDTVSIQGVSLSGRITLAITEAVQNKPVGASRVNIEFYNIPESDAEGSWNYWDDVQFSSNCNYRFTDFEGALTSKYINLIEIENCDFEGLVIRNHDIGISLEGCKNIQFLNCKFYSLCSEPLQIQNCNELYFENCVFSKSTYPVDNITIIDTSSSFSWIMFDNCIFSKIDGTITIKASGITNTKSLVTISNCHFDDLSPVLDTDILSGTGKISVIAPAIGNPVISGTGEISWSDGDGQAPTFYAQIQVVKITPKSGLLSFQGFLRNLNGTITYDDNGEVLKNYNNGYLFSLNKIGNILGLKFKSYFTASFTGTFNISPEPEFIKTGLQDYSFTHGGQDINSQRIVILNNGANFSVGTCSLMSFGEVGASSNPTYVNLVSRGWTGSSMTDTWTSINPSSIGSNRMVTVNDVYVEWE